MGALIPPPPSPWLTVQKKHMSNRVNVLYNFVIEEFEIKNCSFAGVQWSLSWRHLDIPPKKIENKLGEVTVDMKNPFDEKNKTPVKHRLRLDTQVTKAVYQGHQSLAEYLRIISG